jgi:hypothetical protein
MFAGQCTGQYEISVEARGFELARRSILLGDQTEVTESFSLEVATREDTVTVLGTAGYAAPEVASVSKAIYPSRSFHLPCRSRQQQLCRDQVAQRLSDVTRNVSGVQTNFGYGSLYEAFACAGLKPM